MRTECGCRIRYGSKGKMDKIAFCSLHAAAPDLWEACRDLIPWVEWWNPKDGGSASGCAVLAVERARAAIAKAKGETHERDG